MKIIVVGAGPSGILASYKIKINHPNYDVVLIEKDSQIGKRIKVSGNGRCNFSNTNMNEKFFKNGNQIKHILDCFEQEKFYRDINLHYYSDEEGRMYPLTNSSKTVQTLLINKLNKLGVDIHLEEEVISISYGDKIKIITNKNSFNADKVVLTIGGISYLYPESSHDIFKKLNVKETQLYPSLCPIKIKERLPKDIVGKRAKGRVSLLKDRGIVFEEDGEILFKKDGLSGIVIFNASSYITSYNYKNIKIKISLFPDLTKEEIVKQEKEFSRLEILKSYVVEEIADYLSKINKSVYELLTSLEYTFDGLYPFKESQVTSGGISLDEIDLNNLSLKKYPNIYVGGEVIDVDGRCGGYNIHFAMASGYYIGDNIEK